MKDVALEKKINDNLEGIIDTIVFYCGKKNERIIKERLKDTLIYVYDDEFQERRIKEIDFLEVAMDFARDLTSELKVTEERKEELNLIVGEIIFKYSNEEINPSVIKSIGEELSLIDEFKLNLKENVKLCLDVLEHYKKDYKVKDLKKKLANIAMINDELNKASIKIKQDTFKRYCGIEINEHEARELWPLLSSFKKEADFLLDDKEYKKSILAAQAMICKKLGASGNSVPEIIMDARLKRIFLEPSLIAVMENHYQSEYEKKAKDHMSRHTNIDRILTSLKDNDIEVDEAFIRTYLSFKKSTSGAQINDVNGKPACIVFNNDINLYSQDFIDTCIHELVHYMGGTNELINKCRLIYNNDPRYVSLDEAYSNYLAKQGKVEYLKENDVFFPISKDTNDRCTYDCTLEYMDEVFKLYKDKLISIHLGDDIELRKAKLWCPIEEIATSVYKIYKSSEEEKSKVSNQEIQKLIRGEKR